MIKSHSNDIEDKVVNAPAMSEKDLTIAKLTRQLKDSDQRFNILSKAINDAIWDWNMVDNEIQWSRGLFELYGYPEEGSGHNYSVWQENIHKEDKDEVLKSLQDTFINQTFNWKSIYRYRCLNGKYK